MKTRGDLSRRVIALGIGGVVCLSACGPIGTGAQHEADRSIQRGNACPQLNSLCTTPPPKTFYSATTSGGSGNYSWDGVVGDPVPGVIVDPSGNPLANETSTVTQTSSSVTLQSTVTASGTTASTTMTVPKTIPVGTRFSINASVTAEKNANGTYNAWWSRSGVNYTATLSYNADGSTTIVVSGSNGFRDTRTVPRATQTNGAGILPGPDASSECQQDLFALGVAGTYAAMGAALIPGVGEALGLVMAGATLAYVLEGCA